MTEQKRDNDLAKDHLVFKQGQDSLLTDMDTLDEGLQKIKNKLSDLTNIKNLHFLLGAGASSDAIPVWQRCLILLKKELTAIKRKMS